MPAVAICDVTLLVPDTAALNRRRMPGRAARHYGGVLPCGRRFFVAVFASAGPRL